MIPKKSKILLIDDMEMNRNLIIRRLTLEGCDVQGASTGQRGLELIEKQDFDMILLDIAMPGMDGIEVLGHIRKKHAASELPVIMVTAMGSTDQIVQAFTQGANDYVTKPIDMMVLFARINTHIRLKRATQELAVANRKIMQDLTTAAHIQESLLPKDLPQTGNTRFAYQCRPCEQLGGDMLNVFKIDESKLGLYLLDVSGHGIQASLMSSALSHVIVPTPDETVDTLDSGTGSVNSWIGSPSQVAQRLNHKFPMDNTICQYFTLLYGILDLEQSEFIFCNAGAPSPIKITRDGVGSIHMVEGTPIGWILEDCPYDEYKIPLESGDRVYLYSDGITEAMNENHDEFGAEQMNQILCEAREQSLEDGLDQIITEINTWTNNAPHDDISILALEMA